MKIYISSTKRDLAEHRATVDQTLRRMGHDVIGMEQYIAESIKPLDRCQKDVAAADLYVVIVGWCYGSTPVGLSDPSDKRSFVEIELDEAVQKGKTVLAFLLDPGAPWPPDQVDAMGSEPGAGQRVAALRAQLGGSYLSGVFRTPHDLASQVAAAVSAHSLSRFIVERVLGKTSAALADVDPFARGEEVNVSSVDGIKKLIKRSGAARALVLIIDEGRLWWSTRLFLLASLLRTLTTVRQLVFCNSEGAFIGMASPAAIADALVSAFPLIGDFARRLSAQTGSSDLDSETDRQMEEWRKFLDESVSQNTLPGQPPPPPRKLDEKQIKVGVRAPLLERWLGERWVNRCIRVEGEQLSMNDVQQIVDSLLPDVPIERPTSRATEDTKVSVVDRDAFALELAREWIRSGLPRAPVV
jgi:Domain of unknown function (DUF4062)